MRMFCLRVSRLIVLGISVQNAVAELAFKFLPEFAKIC
jgi:hypothetical protein